MSRTSNRLLLRSSTLTLTPNTETYEGKQIFLARVRLKDSVPAGALNLTFEPVTKPAAERFAFRRGPVRFAVALNVNAGAKTTAAAIPAGYIEAKPRSGAPGATSAETAGSLSSHWLSGLALRQFSLPASSR